MQCIVLYFPRSMDFACCNKPCISDTPTNLRYLKSIDRFPPSTYISAFITANNIKFLLLTCPASSADLPGGSSRTSLTSAASSARSSAYPSAATYNPTAPATEEAVKNFFYEVYDAWLKTLMNPFYGIDMPIGSPVFRGRVAAAAKKYL